MKESLRFFSRGGASVLVAWILTLCGTMFPDFQRIFLAWAALNAILAIWFAIVSIPDNGGKK